VRASTGGVALHDMTFQRDATVHIYANSTVENFARKRDARQWSDLSRERRVGDGLSALDANERARWHAHLTEHRFLIVDCVDSQAQQDAADAILREARYELPVRIASVYGDPADVHAKTDEPTESEPRFSFADLVHPRLADGAACVLFLELHGACGQALLDRIFKTHWMLTDFSAQLTTLGRYVILLPRGSLRYSLLHGHAKRGFALELFRVDFLRPWLSRNVTGDLEQCAAAIRSKASGGAWNGSEEELYDWLSSADHKGAAQTLQELLDRSLDVPLAEKAADQALQSQDGASEPLLAALFVASNLPNLPEMEFCSVVEHLLGDRTRLRLGSAQVGEQPVSLVSEWRVGLRAIMRSAGLEVRAGKAGQRTIGFRELHAPSRVQSLLHAEPMFLAENLERLLEAGLLFETTAVLRDGVAGLIAKACAAEPERYSPTWLFSHLATALAPEARAEHVIEKARFIGSFRLLLDLQHAHSARDAAQGPSPVDELFNQALRSPNRFAALFVPDLAALLRDAPGFDSWHWFRQVFERGNADARARAELVLCELPVRGEAESLADLDRVLDWLESAKSGSGARSAAASLLSSWIILSLRCAIAEPTEAPCVAAELFRRYAVQRANGVARITGALLHPAVTSRLCRMEEPASEALRVLLPKEAWDSRIDTWSEEWLETLMPAWNEAVTRFTSELPSDDAARLLVPALALHAWCWHLRAEPDLLAQIAAQIRTAHRKELAGVRAWLSVYIELAGVSTARMASLTKLSKADRLKIKPAAMARKAPLEAFRSGLRGTAQGVGAAQ
jgi:hypothetical protein